MKLLTGLLYFLLSVSAAQVMVIQGEGPPLDAISLSAVYQESFEGDPSGMLEGYLFLGQDKMWTASLENGVYTFNNQTDPNAVYYIYLGTVGSAASIEVTAQYGDFAAAGLLYRFDPALRYYFAFVLTGPNSYAVYKRNAEGLLPVIEGTSGAVAATNRLSITEVAGEMRFYINETFVASISDPEMKGDRAGLLVAGTGMFQLDNMTVYEVPGARDIVPNPLEPGSAMDQPTLADAYLSAAYQARPPQTAMTLEFETNLGPGTQLIRDSVMITPQPAGLYEVRVVTNGDTANPRLYYADAGGSLYKNGQATGGHLTTFLPLWHFGEPFFSREQFTASRVESGWQFSYQDNSNTIEAVFADSGILPRAFYCQEGACWRAQLLSGDAT